MIFIQGKMGFFKSKIQILQEIGSMVSTIHPQ